MACQKRLIILSVKNHLNFKNATAPEEFPSTCSHSEQNGQCGNTSARKRNSFVSVFRKLMTSRVSVQVKVSQPSRNLVLTIFLLGM